MHAFSFLIFFLTAQKEAKTRRGLDPHSYQANSIWSVDFFDFHSIPPSLLEDAR